MWEHVLCGFVVAVVERVLSVCRVCVSVWLPLQSCSHAVLFKDSAKLVYRNLVSVHYILLWNIREIRRVTNGYI